MHCFVTTLRLLLHIDVIHQASASCPRSWAQAEWIFNHIRDTFPGNELQWVGMGLKQCRLLSTKTVSGTCSINHQWSPDIVSISIRCNQTFCVEINWTESIISSKDLGKCLGMFFFVVGYPIEDGSPDYTYIIINQDCFMVLSIL